MNLVLSGYPLLERLPDETFFSLFSRLHSFWGMNNPSNTSLILFGHPLSRISHDFPHGSPCLNGWYEGEGDFSRINLVDVTLLKFYKPFMTDASLALAILNIMQGWGGALRERLSCLSYQVHTSHPLKACPDCIVEDMSSFGWSYWHLQHQFPGVWICLKHGSPLLQLSSNSAVTHEYVLPLASLSSAHRGNLKVGGLSPISDLANFIISVVQGEERIEGQALMGMYQCQMMKRGFLDGDGKCDWSVIADDFIRYAQGVGDLPELHFFPETIQKSGRVLCKVLQDYQLHLHPLRHMLVQNWLWNNPSDFWNEYHEMMADVSTPLWKSKCELMYGNSFPERNELTALYASVKGRVDDLADVLGVSTVLLRNSLKEHGVQLRHYRKEVSDGNVSRLVSFLDSGVSLDGIASELSISRQAVRSILNNDDGLRSRWRGACFENFKQLARSRLKSMDSDLLFCRVSIADKMSPEICRFLIRWDRDWMIAYLKYHVRKWARSFVGLFKMTDSDVMLCAQILMYSIRHRASSSYKGVCTRLIFRRYMPEFSSFDESPSSFPLSRRLIKILTGNKF